MAMELRNQRPRVGTPAGTSVDKGDGIFKELSKADHGRNEVRKREYG